MSFYTDEATTHLSTELTNTAVMKETSAPQLRSIQMKYGSNSMHQASKDLVHIKASILHILLQSAKQLQNLLQQVRENIFIKLFDG